MNVVDPLDLCEELLVKTKSKYTVTSIEVVSNILDLVCSEVPKRRYPSYKDIRVLAAPAIICTYGPLYPLVLQHTKIESYEDILEIIEICLSVGLMYSTPGDNPTDLLSYGTVNLLEACQLNYNNYYKNHIQGKANEGSKRKSPGYSQAGPKSKRT